MATQELRPMGIGDILDVTFRLYRQRFQTFLLIALVVYVPFSLLMAGLTPLQGPAVGQRAAEAPVMVMGERQVAPIAPNPAAFVIMIVGLMVFAIVLIPLCSAALVHNISAAYLGEELTAGQSYRRAAPRLLALIGTQLLVGLLVGVGFLLCVVPGVIFSLWFFVVAPVVILEGLSGPSAMGRSRELMRENLGKAFALGLVAGLLSWVISFALGMVIGLIPWPHVVLRAFAGNLVNALVLPIQAAPSILLYYDLRIRKEAFDLQRLSANLSQVTGASPFAT